jgi:predicted metal-dependent HD superfamily phosphohydrolase
VDLAYNRRCPAWGNLTWPKVEEFNLANGASESDFLAYDEAIRAEYQWVTEPEYRVGRTKVLQAFLDRESIFHTSLFRQFYEASARVNLSARLAQI